MRREMKEVYLIKDQNGIKVVKADRKHCEVTEANEIIGYIGPNDVEELNDRKMVTVRLQFCQLGCGCFKRRVSLKVMIEILKELFDKSDEEILEAEIYSWGDMDGASGIVFKFSDIVINFMWGF